MKLSARDIEILEKFANINTSVQFKAGNIQKTVSPTKSVLMKAQMDAEFQRDFAIFDLSRLLRMVALVDDHEIDLLDTHLIIRNAGATIKYFYCNPANLARSRNDLKSENDPVVQPDLQFVLTGVIYQKMLKAIGMVGVKQLAFLSENNELYVESYDALKRIPDSFRMHLGTYAGGKAPPGPFVISSDNLKLIPGDYAVTIQADKLASFEGITGSPTANTSYWVSLESD